MMRIASLLLAALSLLGALPASAQTVITTAPGDTVEIEIDSGSPSAGYPDVELEEANRGIRAARTALIVTSATAGVGMIVATTAWRHCTYFEPNLSEGDVFCNDRGTALLSAGSTIFGLSAIGMITSGIILGVRKGKRRRIYRERRAQQYRTRLEWDTASSQLRF